MITKEQFEEWKTHPVTIEIYEEVEKAKQDLLDTFSAGLIYGINNLPNDKESLEFAVAASCLMHSIPGDLPLISVEEVKNLAKGTGSGRVQR